jgi:hypothetical protein
MCYEETSAKLAAPRGAICQDVLTERTPLLSGGHMALAIAQKLRGQSDFAPPKERANVSCAGSISRFGGHRSLEP